MDEIKKIEDLINSGNELMQRLAIVLAYETGMKNLPFMLCAKITHYEIMFREKEKIDEYFRQSLAQAIWGEETYNSNGLIDQIRRSDSGQDQGSVQFTGDE